jgi:hypothetical protein
LRVVVLFLVQEVMMSTDVVCKDGVRMDYKEAVKLRHEQTVSMGSKVGWSGG